MPTYFDSLAALKDGRYYKARAQKPVHFKIDTDGLGLSIELPGPQILAQTFALPWLRERLDVYRSGASLLTRPKGSDTQPTASNLAALAAELRLALAALPERPAGRPYRDAQQAASLGADRMDAYLADVVHQVRQLAPPWKPRAVTSTTPPAPAMTPAERKAAQRERERADEEASAREWLEAYRSEATPGERIEAEKLYALALDVIGDYLEDEEEREDGGRYRIPRRRLFYQVADELLGARRRSHGAARTYTITPKEATVNLADAVIERVVEKLADETLDEIGDSVRDEIFAKLCSGDRLGALLLQRDQRSATGTDDAVVDLAAVRANRSF